MNIWSRLGLSVAIAAVFSIVVMEVFQDKTYYQLFKWYACATLLGGGGLLALVGWQLRKRGLRLVSAALPAIPGTDAEPSEVPPELSVSSHFNFWGPLLIVFGSIVFFIPYKEKAQPVAAREVKVEQKAPEPPPPSPSPVAEVTPPAPVAFPKLNIQGFVYRPPRSAVIIDGKSYFVGDTYENAEIVAIEANSVTLEVSGQRNIIRIDHALQSR